ncbi:MAG: DUF2892 domain-containing protein [Rhizobiaceae bacterium]
MKKNVGAADRLMRILLGSALLIWAIAYPTAPYSYGGWVGLIFVITGLWGWCPIYRILSFSTKQ